MALGRTLGRRQVQALGRALGRKQVKAPGRALVAKVVKVVGRVLERALGRWAGGKSSMEKMVARMHGLPLVSHGQRVFMEPSIGKALLAQTQTQTVVKMGKVGKALVVKVGKALVAKVGEACVGELQGGWVTKSSKTC